MEEKHLTFKCDWQYKGEVNEQGLPHGRGKLKLVCPGCYYGLHAALDQAELAKSPGYFIFIDGICTSVDPNKFGQWELIGLGANGNAPAVSYIVATCLGSVKPEHLIEGLSDEVDAESSNDPPPWYLSLGQYTGGLHRGLPSGSGEFVYDASGTRIKGAFGGGNPHGLVQVFYPCGCLFRGEVGYLDPHEPIGGYGELVLNCDNHRSDYLAWGYEAKPSNFMFAKGHILTGLWDFEIWDDFKPIPTDIKGGLD